MVQAIIDISDETNRVLNIIKARHNLKDKSEAIDKMAEDYEQVFEPEIRPEYLKKLLRMNKEPHIKVRNGEHLRTLVGLGDTSSTTKKASKIGKKE